MLRTVPIIIFSVLLTGSLTIAQSEPCGSTSTIRRPTLSCNDKETTATACTGTCRGLKPNRTADPVAAWIRQSRVNSEAATFAATARQRSASDDADVSTICGGVVLT